MDNVVLLKVRRLDCEDAEKIYKMKIEPNITYCEFIKKFMKLLQITQIEEKIIKIRNNDGILIPFINLVNSTNTDKVIVIEITNIHQDVPVISCDSSLNSVYMDAVRLKLRNMESRISRVESLVPHLKWRRQSLMEHTTHSLGLRVAFLDRRIDELTPPQWNEHLQKSMS